MIPNLFCKHLDISLELDRMLSKFIYPWQEKLILSPIKFNKIISNLLSSNSRFLLGRLGETESRLIYATIKNYNYTSRLVRRLQHNAGIGPANELNEISRIYIRSIEALDFMAHWANPGQNTVNSLLYKRSLLPTLFNIENLNPLHLSLVYKITPESTWMSSLNEKKILVVHPFAENLLKSNTKDLGSFESALIPNFNATFIAPPVTYGYMSNSFSFLSNLEELKNNVYNLRDTFDVALIAAGGYGLPVAEFIYAENIAKSVLHVGGALILYFGIASNRWLSPPYSEFYKNYGNLASWSRPSLIDIKNQKQHLSVEKGCYI